MTLGELIETLETHGGSTICKIGFGRPHSYRGYYDRLAFEPKENVTIADMLKDAKSALGNTYQGYKGGDFTMDEWTEVYLAEYGCCGEEIGQTLLKLMIGNNP